MSTARIYGGAPYNAPSYTATSTPGFTGDGSGLTNVSATNVTLNNPNYAVITDGSSQLTTEQFLSNVRGGTGADSSAFSGVAKVNTGTWSASLITNSDITPATITGASIASATITGSNIASGTVTGTNIGANTITNSNITAATITGASIASATVTGSNIASATVTGSNIASATITGTNIASNTIPDSSLQTISTAGKVSNSATTATNLNTASAIVARDASGNFSAGNVTTTQLTQLPNANAQSSIQSAFVATSNATATTLFTLATVSAGTHGTTYLINCNVSLGDVTGGVNTGTYQFQFKVKNIGGTLTLSSIISNTTILDGTLTNTAVSVSSSSANALVQVTGIAATTINWSGNFTITQVNF
jgi:hypothetical protein